MARGRKPKRDRNAVRTVPVVFYVTEAERAWLNDRRKRARVGSRSAWVRLRCGLPAEPAENEEDEAPL